VLVLYLILTGYFTPVMILVALAVPTLIKLYPAFLKPKPETRPEGFPDGQGGWPLYFAPQAFINNRAFGMWFMLGLILDVILRLVFRFSGSNKRPPPGLEPGEVFLFRSIW